MGNEAQALPQASTVAHDRQAVMFRVKGLPKAQPRPRFTGGSGSVVSTTGKEVKAWRAAIWGEIQRLMWDFGPEIRDVISDRPVEMDVWFLLPTRDRRRFGLACGAKPDVDNLLKCLMDSIVAGDGTIRRGAGLLPDDARVADFHVRKRWCDQHDAGVVVTIRPLGPDEAGPFAGDGPTPSWLQQTPQAVLEAQSKTRPHGRPRPVTGSADNL